MELNQSQEQALDQMFTRGAQRFNASRVLDHFGGLMAWPMGAGKTPSSLTHVERVREYALRYHSQEADCPTLIICPAGVRSQWAWEAREWIGKVMHIGQLNMTDLEEMVKLSGTLSVKGIIKGIGCSITIEGIPSVRARLIQMVDDLNPDYVIVNYEIANIHQQWIQSKTWFGLIVDEAHAIKNDGTQRARSTMSVDAAFTLLLTGTPVDNRPHDLYNLLKRLDPGKEFIRRVGKEKAPNRKNCPIAVAKTLFGASAYNRYGEMQDARIKASNLFGFPVSQYNIPDLPKTCEHCRYFTGDKFNGTCKYDGCTKGKAPVPVRYRGPSPWWGTRDAFEDRYCTFKQTRFGKQFLGARNEQELNRRLLSGWMTRIPRPDVDHPMYQYVSLDLTDQQQVLYDQVKRGILKSIQSLGEMSDMQIKSNLTKMLWLERVAASTPKDFYDALAKSKPEWMHIIRPPKPSNKGVKQEWILSFLESLGNDKAVIFTQWRTVSDPLFDVLEKKGYKPLIIRGAMSRADRDRAQILFNDPDSGHNVIIVTRAGFEGINLHKGVRKGQTLHGIFTDIGWVPKHITQPMGRLVRVGLKGSVWFWFLKGNGTIDEYKIDTLKDKQTYMDMILEGKITPNVDLFAITSKAKLLKVAGG